MRLVALPLAFTMVIAILTAKRSDITGVTALVGFEEWSYLVFFLWLALAGAGSCRSDALIGKPAGGGPRPAVATRSCARRSSPPHRRRPPETTTCSPP